jgi:hypothetical protein
MSLSFLLLPTVGGSGRARADVLGRSLVVSGKERWWGGALSYLEIVFSVWTGFYLLFNNFLVNFKFGFGLFWSYLSKRRNGD